MRDSRDPSMMVISTTVGNVKVIMIMIVIYDDER